MAKLKLQKLFLGAVVLTLIFFGGCGTSEVERFTLTININNENWGSVHSNPDRSTYVKGTEVELTAQAEVGYVFEEWQGDAAGSEVGIIITMDKNKEVLAVFAEDPGGTTEFAGGTGEEGDPYLIGNASQLNNVRNYLDAHFKVIDDIDLSEYWENQGWEPIGSLNDPFTGGFDGDNYSIINLKIDRSGSFNGLFGCIEDAVLENISLEDVDIFGGYGTGGLVGLNENGTIRNSSSTGTVEGNNVLGGLVGWNEGGVVENCFSSCTLFTTGGLWRAGGLIGWNDGGEISYSYALGNFDLTQTSGNLRVIGGFVGFNSGGALINKCYAYVDVIGNFHTAEDFGGFAGVNSGTILESYATGEVLGGENAGGFVGMANSGSLIKDSFSSGDVNASDFYGGFVGKNSGAIENCYSFGKLFLAGTNRGAFSGSNTTQGNITSCYFDKDIAEYEVSDGGDARTTLQMQAGTPGDFINPDGTIDVGEDSDNLMYEEWDDTIWDFGTDNDYPKLQWQD